MQKPITELTSAPFLRRVGSNLIDTVGLGLLVLATAITVPALILLVAIIATVAYYGIFEGSPAQATIGKRLLGLRVINEDGSNLTVKQAMIRAVCRWVLALPYCLTYFFAFFTRRRQSLHDLILKQLVIEASTEADLVSSATQTAQGLFAQPFTSSNLTELKQLHELYQAGAITEQEYQERKAKLL